MSLRQHLQHIDRVRAANPHTFFTHDAYGNPIELKGNPMKDIHIEINETLLLFRNEFWKEAQSLVHENIANLSGYEVACVAIWRAAQAFRVDTSKQLQGESNDR